MIKISETKIILNKQIIDLNQFVRPTIILIVFEDTNTRNVVYEIIRKSKPEWHCSGYQLIIPGKLDDTPFIFTTESAMCYSKSFAGYNVIDDLYYIKKSHEPEDLINYIEKYVDSAIIRRKTHEKH